MASEEAWKSFILFFWKNFKQEPKDLVCVSEKALWQGHREWIAEGGDKEDQLKSRVHWG